MNLYLIKQNDFPGYDTFDCAVVVAPDEETARNINPSGGMMDWAERQSNDHFLADWCDSPEKVRVELIGTAVEGSEVGVVVASFNAG